MEESPDMPSFAALLRAVNLGERNKVSMPRLRSLVSALGYDDVTTYVQSGNVVFRGPGGKADEISAAFERAIDEEFGLTIAVIIRTAGELRKVADRNPFLADERDPKKLQVLFLDRRPPAQAKRALDPDRSPPDRFELRGRELYLHRPAGSARSKLTIDYFERCLRARGTVRNWRTVMRLAELTAELTRADGQPRT
jgi:uncharacterized protein (DUF1697 family)